MIPESLPTGMAGGRSEYNPLQQRNSRGTVMRRIRRARAGRVARQHCEHRSRGALAAERGGRGDGASALRRARRRGQQSLLGRLGRPLHPVQRHDRRHRVPRRRRAAAPRRADRRHRRIRRQPRRVPREVRRSDRERGLRSRVQRAVSGRCIGAHAGGRTHRAIRRRARDESRLHDRRRPQRCGGGASQPQDRSADHCASRSSQRADGSSRGGEGVVRDSLRRRAPANAGATKPSTCPASTSTSPASTRPKRRRAAACSITSASR